MRVQAIRFYKELIAENGLYNLRISGNSMEPFIIDGQTVVITTYCNLLPGNCYLFRDNDQLVLHRLAGKLKDKKLLFIGDNSHKIEKVNEENVIGVLHTEINKIKKQLIAIVNSLFIFIYKISPRIGSKFYLIRRKIVISIVRSGNEKRVCKT
jgi:hypothetical protein